MRETIQQKIFIKPELLTGDLKKNIIVEASRLLLGKCHVDYGCVLKIIDVNILENNIHNSNSSIIFMLEVQVETFKPFVNQILDVTTVTSVYPDGFFVDYTTQRILIPIKNSDIKVGDKLSVILTAIQFKNNKFCLIGDVAAT